MPAPPGADTAARAEALSSEGPKLRPAPARATCPPRPSARSQTRLARDLAVTCPACGSQVYRTHHTLAWGPWDPAVDLSRRRLRPSDRRAGTPLAERLGRVTRG